VTRGRRRSIAVQRIANPEVVSWPLLWITTAVLVIDDVRLVMAQDLPSRDPGPTIVSLLLATMIGQAITFAILLLARFTWLRTAWARRHPMMMVWSFVLASLIAQVNPLWVASIDAPAGVDRFVIQTASLIIGASIIAAVAEHRREVAELRATEAALSAGVQVRDSELGVLRTATQRDVDAVLDDLLADLASIPADLPDVLMATSEDSLRPLSHALASTSDPITVEPPSVPRPRWSEVFRKIATAPLIAPFFTAVLMTIIAARFTIRDPVNSDSAIIDPTVDGQVVVQVDLGSAFLALGKVGVVFVVTLVAAFATRRMAARLLMGRRPARRWLIIIASVLPLAIIVQVTVALLFPVGPGIPGPGFTPAGTLQFLLPIVAVSLLMGVVRTVSVAQRDIRVQLDDANAALSQQLARVNNDIWAERQRLAEAVHGPVRGALIAGALEAARIVREGADDAQIAVVAERTRQRLTDARARLTLDAAALDVEAALQDAARLWRGICRIECRIDDPARAVLGSDPGCAAVVISVSMEAVHNAVQHGQATEIGIDISAAPAGVSLSVVDDGRGPDAGGEAGLGSKRLDELCRGWSLTRESGLTRLRAEIPV
jgi:signal transduction histidine kinase